MTNNNSSCQPVEVPDLYIPSDKKLDAICYKGTWYIRTNAGNLQIAREILNKQEGDSV